ncbi:phosphotransferase [Schaalia sp. 19OD2882]|uniref:phosphotransferase n=1 Tax=Schaalia sp. 19OD2882 TaxID=2794089 RepID=UPI001C1EF0B7|nr:phosphotransferase [Schaalia sp. 19OD2882]QWW20094.1 phosphotransferase [Schaalia sp. 19OD2882]
MTRTKTPLELAALATVAVPGLQVAAVRPVAHSDELVSITGIVDSSGNRWTITCPHDTVGGLDMEAQQTVLARLAKATDHRRIPFDVPRPAGATTTPEGDRVLVHKDLGGRAMVEEDFEDSQMLPASLAKALASLHNLPPLIYTGADLPSYDAPECRMRHLSVLDEAARATVIPANLWNRWEAALEDVTLWRFAAVPVHGDLQSTAVVVERGSVVALTGFHGAHVGDPAVDVSWVLAQAGDDFLARFQEAYSMERHGPDLHLFTRAQLISELALVRWLVHGIHAQDRQIVRDARTMIQELSQDVGDDLIVPRRPNPHDVSALTEEDLRGPIDLHEGDVPTVLNRRVEAPRGGAGRGGGRSVPSAPEGVGAATVAGPTARERAGLPPRVRVRSRPVRAEGSHGEQALHQAPPQAPGGAPRGGGPEVAPQDAIPTERLDLSEVPHSD